MPASYTRRKKAEDLIKRTRGNRTTAYDPAFDDMAFKLALLQLDDRRMAEVFGVSVVTLNAWKIRYPSFLKALNSGKAPADAEVVESLIMQAKGHYRPVEKVMVVNGKPKVVKYKEYFPPSAAATIFWLKNRQRDTWRDIQRQELTGKDDGPIKTEGTQTVILDASKLDPDARGLLREALKAAKG